MVSTLISAITGILYSKGPDYADISMGGFTFRVSAPLKTGTNLLSRLRSTIGPTIFTSQFGMGCGVSPPV